MNWIRSRLSICALACASFWPAAAAVLPAEKALPDDTLLLVTAPDFKKALTIYKHQPQSQLWNDPAMRPFRERLAAKWNDEFVKPLERDLQIKLDDYTSLLQGQLTLAVTANGWDGVNDKEPGFILLLDAKDKSGQLKKNLADIRKKWTDAGKTLRTEKVRDVEFTVLSLSSNDVPKTVRKFFPATPEVQELGDEKPAAKTPEKSEIFFGQHESMLIVASSLKGAEQVVLRLTGGSAPVLADQAAYQATHLTLFREAPLYGWVNAKALVDALVRAASQKKDNPEAPNPFDLKPDKIAAALGFSGLRSAAFTVCETEGGELAEFFLGVPESSRQGLFKILAGEPKETTPPPFVPADAVKFQRWRIDGQKSWATLEKIINDISPQAMNTVNFLLDSAATYAKEKDPGFDIRKSLIGNLGDDLISFEKAPRASNKDAQDNPPALLLVGSPNASQMASGLKGILLFANQATGAPPDEREFLGRKIYSVPLRGLPIPTGDGAKPSTPRTLSYAASGSYVAFSTDAATLEEYLRSSDSQGKALRETAGLTEAAQKVTTQASSLFGYENQAQTMKVLLETLRTAAQDTNSPAASLLSLLPMGATVAGAEQGLKSWLDFSLLPPFEKVAKYFHYVVYGGTANAEGLSLKFYSPTPPTLKTGAAENK